jgi:hypothetical protein
MIAFGAFLVFMGVVLFYPKKEKKPKFKLHRGGRYDSNVKYD